MKSKNEITNLMHQHLQNSTDLLYYSSVMSEFNNLMSSSDTQVDQLGKIIEKDPGLTASVLKVANSSFYGVSKKVANVKQAVSIIGFVALEKIFTVNLLKNSLNKQKTQFGENLWKHSLGVAIASQQIILNTKPQLSDQVFTAGLLHDLGKFIMMDLLQEEYNLLIKDFNKNNYQYSIALENKYMGIDHQQVGAFFAEAWLFPDIIVNSIMYHHNINYTPKDKDVVAAVNLGNNIVKALEIGQSSSLLVELIPKWVWSFLEIKKDELSKIIQLTQQKYNAYLAYLNMV